MFYTQELPQNLPIFFCGWQLHPDTNSPCVGGGGGGCTHSEAITSPCKQLHTQQPQLSFPPPPPPPPPHPHPPGRYSSQGAAEFCHTAAQESQGIPSRQSSQFAAECCHTAMPRSEDPEDRPVELYLQKSLQKQDTEIPFTSSHSASAYMPRAISQSEHCVWRNRACGVPQES